ncbi:MAG: sterol desaturase family protein [Gammaproteobacteria bacterium]|nr:sterol desaturase family protein [Gammaproteobacteria bacterium]NKB64528.1 sterol desaturase family protein [Gammaproteobacteria bacterium]
MQVSSNHKSVSGAETESTKNRSAWNYTPPLPLKTSPYFRWPLDIVGILKWMIGGWFPISERLIILGLSVFCWVYLSPALERCVEFSLDWIAMVYLRNLGLMILVAGGLHLYFYILKRQGNERRYDARPLGVNKGVFTFRSQVRDNMFWSLASGVTIWTAYEVLMLWALANGYAPSLSLSEDLFWLALMIFLLPMWETTHFFLIHRLIHWPPFYRRIHALHHRNTNVGPWSGLSMHPVEHLIYLSTVLIHFIVPANPLLIMFHLQYFTLSAATTHTGYEGVIVKGKVILPLGTFHHQMHHRYFECNYGGLETPWDQWTGSFHDGTQESHKRFLDRQRQKAAI